MSVYYGIIPEKLLNTASSVLNQSTISTLNLQKRVEEKYNAMVEIDVSKRGMVIVKSNMSLPNELIEDAIKVYGEKTDSITTKSICMSLEDWNQLFC